MPDLDFSDPAFYHLPFQSYLGVARVASEMVTLYGGDGPPFPILNLIGLLDATTKIYPANALERGVYGYSLPLDYARHRKHAALFLDTTVSSAQLFATLFHEAGHVLLHLLPRSPDLALPYDRHDGPPLSRDHAQAEIEADLFARLTMMPHAWVQRAWPWTTTLTDTPEEATRLTAGLFNVPADWMAARLQTLGLLPPPGG
ncbi:MAG: hypothetical protein M3Z04_03780 [Chloroflexota bacterium]|nr:hypothetical protein [Chloroflexota bacterium]